MGRKLKGPPVREGLCGASRGQVCDGRDVGHDSAVHRHGGHRHRPRRRGHFARLDLVCRLRCGRALGGPAGLRRDRRVVRHRSAGHRSEDHPADQGNCALPPARRRGRPGRDPRYRQEAQAAGCRRLCPMRGRALQGEIRGLDRRHGHQQLPTQQDHHLRRGRRRDHQRPEALRACPPLPRRGHDPFALRRVARRRTVGGLRGLQFPHERVHRSGAEGAIAEAGDHLRPPSRRRPQGPRGDCRPARTQTPQVGGPRGRPGLGSLPGPGHEEAARQVPAPWLRRECRRRRPAAR